MNKKIILVTGGSRGIGANIVYELAHNENYQVILNYNKSFDEAEKIQDILLEQNIKIDIMKADVSNREEVHNMIAKIIKMYNKIDVLINNAGISKVNLFTDISDEEWNEVMNVNLNSVFITSQEVLKNMISEKSGCIINISSVWGLVGASCEVHYAVSKAGVDAMTKSLAKEMGPSHIRVNSIAPGIIDTQMNAHLSKEDIDDLKEEIPLEKIGRPIDITKCVEWLIEDQYTTGQVISVNGGWVI